MSLDKNICLDKKYYGFISYDTEINNKICVMVHTPPNDEYNTIDPNKGYEMEHLHIHADDKYKNKSLTNADKDKIKIAVKNDRNDTYDYKKFKELFEAIDKNIVEYKKL